jgi:hypothetical protein
MFSSREERSIKRGKLVLVADFIDLKIVDDPKLDQLSLDLIQYYVSNENIKKERVSSQSSVHTQSIISVVCDLFYSNLTKLRRLRQTSQIITMMQILTYTRRIIFDIN